MPYKIGRLLKKVKMVRFKLDCLREFLGISSNLWWLICFVHFLYSWTYYQWPKDGMVGNGLEFSFSSFSVISLFASWQWKAIFFSCHVIICLFKASFCWKSILKKCQTQKILHKSFERIHPNNTSTLPSFICNSDLFW